MAEKIIVESQDRNRVVVDTSGDAVVTRVITRGPKGIELDQASAVNDSLIYYDAEGQTFKADDRITVSTVVNGGFY